MPRDSWVGVHECQQSVAGGLATFSHPSLPHLTQRCYVTQYNNKVLAKIFISKNCKFCIIKIRFLDSAVKGIAHWYNLYTSGVKNECNVM